MFSPVFRRCPACGGSIVRMHDEVGQRVLTCQHCTWGEWERPAHNVQPLQDASDDRLSRIAWWVVVVGILIGIASIGLMILLAANGANRPPE